MRQPHKIPEQRGASARFPNSATHAITLGTVAAIDVDRRMPAAQGQLAAGWQQIQIIVGKEIDMKIIELGTVRVETQFSSPNKPLDGGTIVPLVFTHP
jgi:hypothetical protein